MVVMAWSGWLLWVSERQRSPSEAQPVTADIREVRPEERQAGARPERDPDGPVLECATGRQLARLRDGAVRERWW